MLIFYITPRISSRSSHDMWYFSDIAQVNGIGATLHHPHIFKWYSTARVVCGTKIFTCFYHVAFYLQHGNGSGAIVSCREMKFGTRYESPTSGRLGVDEPVLVPKEISSGSKMAKRETASPWIGLESSPAPGPSGTGLRVTCRTDWSFLAPYQGREKRRVAGA